MGTPELHDLDKDPIAETSHLVAAVPVLDIASLTANTIPTAGVVQNIAQALKEWGFFQVVNHGVPADLIDQAWRQTRRFFSGPQAQKEALLRTRANPWGYYNNELTKNQRDKKEVFDYTTDGVDPIYTSENRWPDDAAFSDTMRKYLSAASDLSFRLMRAFCVGLELPPDYMYEKFGGKHTGFVRLNHYPVDDPLCGSELAHQPVADLGVHHHTDAGVLTVLLQDDVGGLQVHREGMWHDITPTEGALVINTGDMMQVWSNDLYKAAVHRGLAMQSKDRYSIPFFFNPPAGTRVDPLPSVANDERPARYRSIEWAEFRGKRTDGDYADYGAEVQISQFRI